MGWLPFEVEASFRLFESQLKNSWISYVIAKDDKPLNDIVICMVIGTFVLFGAISAFQNDLIVGALIGSGLALIMYVGAFCAFLKLQWQKKTPDV